MTAIASQLLQVKRQINTQEIQEHRNRSGTVNYLQVQTNITNITHEKMINVWNVWNCNFGADMNYVYKCI